MSVNPMRYNLHVRAREPFILKNIRALCREIGKTSQTHLVLELGCGLGYYTHVMNELGLKVIGLDIDRSTLSQIISMRLEEGLGLPQPSLVCGNAISSPFKDHRFSLVLATELIEHLPDSDIFLRDIGQLLRENGTLILTTVCLDGVLPVSDFLHTEGAEKHYKIGYTTKELRNLLEGRGFVIEDICYAFSGINRVLMECIKAFYKKKAGSYKSKRDVFKVANTVSFKIYKQLFPALIVINAFDRFFANFIKGDIIMIRAKKPGYTSL